MRFSIRYRVEGGYFAGRKGTRAEGKICRGGWLSGSSEYSEIMIIYDRKVKSTQNKKCYQLVPISQCSKPLLAAWEANGTFTNQKLVGPASLKNEVIVYPCNRSGCWVWCTCRLCNDISKLVDDEENCAMKDHDIYHKAWHLEC